MILADEVDAYLQNVCGEHTSSPVLSSGAQQPLAHCEPTAHRAAQLVPVTVDVTQVAFAQQACVVQSWPGTEQLPAQYFAGAQTAAVPSIRTLQQPLLH